MMNLLFILGIVPTQRSIHDWWLNWRTLICRVISVWRPTIDHALT